MDGGINGWMDGWIDQQCVVEDAQISEWVQPLGPCTGDFLLRGPLPARETTRKRGKREKGEEKEKKIDTACASILLSILQSLNICIRF